MGDLQGLLKNICTSAPGLLVRDMERSHLFFFYVLCEHKDAKFNEQIEV